MWKYNYTVSTELYHYGIKGMRWGYRKIRSYDSPDLAKRKSGINSLRRTVEQADKAGVIVRKSRKDLSKLDRKISKTTNETKLNILQKQRNQLKKMEKIAVNRNKEAVQRVENDQDYLIKLVGKENVRMIPMETTEKGEKFVQSRERRFWNSSYLLLHPVPQLLAKDKLRRKDKYNYKKFVEEESKNLK